MVGRSALRVGEINSSKNSVTDGRFMIVLINP